MRIAKAAYVRLGKFEVCLGAWMATLSFVAFVAMPSATIWCGLVALRGASSPPPITVAIVGGKASATMNRPTQVLVTNLGHHRYHFTFSTEIFTNGIWHDEFVQSSNSELRPQSQDIVLVPIPLECRAWRVKLVARRVLGRAETGVARLLHRLKVEYPIGRNFEVKGPEILNRKYKATANVYG